MPDENNPIIEENEQEESTHQIVRHFQYNEISAQDGQETGNKIVYDIGTDAKLVSYNNTTVQQYLDEHPGGGTGGNYNFTGVNKILVSNKITDAQTGIESPTITETDYQIEDYGTLREEFLQLKEEFNILKNHLKFESKAPPTNKVSHDTNDANYAKETDGCFCHSAHILITISNYKLTLGFHSLPRTFKGRIQLYYSSTNSASGRENSTFYDSNFIEITSSTKLSNIQLNSSKKYFTIVFTEAETDSSYTKSSYEYVYGGYYPKVVKDGTANDYASIYFYYIGTGKRVGEDIKEENTENIISPAHDKNNSSILDYNLLDLIYPVGSYYISSAERNPTTLFGGTWVRVQGRMILGSYDGRYDSRGDYWATYLHFGPRRVGSRSGSAYTPYHTHSGGVGTVSTASVKQGSSTAKTVVTGVGKASVGYSGTQRNANTSSKVYGNYSSITNLPPFQVAHIWRRTA